MRPFRIEIDPPFFAQFSYFGKAVEQVSIQQFSPDTSILSFDVSVLHWSSWLDELKADPAGCMTAPLFQLVTDELRAIIATDVRRATSPSHQLLQHPDHSQAGKRSVRLYHQRFTIKVVDNIQEPEPSSIRQAVAHKLNAPHLVRRRGYAYRLLYPLGQTLLCPSSDIEFHLRVNAVNLLMVPGIIFIPKPVTTLPKTYGGMFGGKLR